MSILAKLLQFLPAIIQAVVGVEAAIQAPGATKKLIVLNAITAAAGAGEKTPDPVVQGISSLIDQTVTTLNASGVFKTNPKVDAAQ